MSLLMCSLYGYSGLLGLESVLLCESPRIEAVDLFG